MDLAGILVFNTFFLSFASVRRAMARRGRGDGKNNPQPTFIAWLLCAYRR